MPLYSIARDIPSGKEYVNADFVEHDLSGVEGMQSYKRHSLKAFAFDSALGVLQSSLVNLKLL